MTESGKKITEKITELEMEMKAIGLWQRDLPQWVNSFEEKIFTDEKDFAQWLQYVFIANHSHTNDGVLFIQGKKMIVPQAIKFFGDDVHKGKLLQILIEIDSLL